MCNSLMKLVMRIRNGCMKPKFVCVFQNILIGRREAELSLVIVANTIHRPKENFNEELKFRNRG